MLNNKMMNMNMNILLVVLILVLLMVSMKFGSPFMKVSSETYVKPRICCIYAYYEKDERYKNNFKFFLENGMLDDVDYYIVINGSCSLNIMNTINKKHISVKIEERENKGYDFGAYCYIINKYKLVYDYYFFINTSVIGPYIKNNEKWTDKFIELFDDDDNIKLVGTSINIMTLEDMGKYNLPKFLNRPAPFTHIQSMFFCMNKFYFDYLVDTGFFEINFDDLTNIADIVAYGEISLSQIALQKGWNINSILPKYRGLDYVNMKENINFSSGYGDPYHKGAYFGGTIDKHDAVFYKSYRLEDSSSRRRDILSFIYNIFI